jgi:ribosomal protein S18 acetylase RimI-like enzyme
MDATLIPFDADCTERVLGWITEAPEAERWAGVTEWPPTPDLLDDWHADPDVHAFLLIAPDATSVGYGEIWVDAEESEAELARLLVDPGQRNRGYGRQLVSLLTDQARHRGFDEVWLRVRSENDQAIACYRAAGFVRALAAEEEAFNVGQPWPYVWMHAGAGAAPTRRAERRPS